MAARSSSSADDLGDRVGERRASPTGTAARSRSCSTTWRHPRMSVAITGVPSQPPPSPSAGSPRGAMRARRRRARRTRPRCRAARREADPGLGRDALQVGGRQPVALLRVERADHDDPCPGTVAQEGRRLEQLAQPLLPHQPTHRTDQHRPIGLRPARPGIGARPPPDRPRRARTGRGRCRCRG
jgi:hypothetical protein